MYIWSCKTKIMLDKLFILILNLVQYLRNRGGYSRLHYCFYSILCFYLSYYQYKPRSKNLFQLGFNKYILLMPLGYYFSSGTFVSKKNEGSFYH
jgi:hypothetical protein